MDHGEALAAAETALRNIVRELLPDWQTRNGAPDTGRLAGKRAEAEKRRDGAVIADDLLSFTEWHHLVELITKNWEPFKPVFDDQQRTKVFLGIISDYRNDVAHSRELLDFEKHLLIGASGQLRNLVALYTGRMAASTQFYPIIERVVDHFGNVGSERGTDTNLRLNVGDVLTFECRAYEPGRGEVQWHLEWNGPYCPTQDDWEVRAIGAEVRLRLTVSEGMVSEHQAIGIYIRTDGRFHRYGRRAMPYDDQVSFVYAVNPPHDA